MTGPTPTWYDLLDVDPDATPEQIRTAWKDAIAELDPGDRRFRRYNQAAEVLLDPQRRAEYDASLAATDDEDPAPAPDAPRAADGITGDAVTTTTGAPGRGRRFSRAPRAGAVPTWLLAALAVLTAAAIGVAAWLWTAGTAASVEESTRSAQAAAEQAIVPILSYDHQTLEADQERAHAYLTGDYRTDYDKLFAVIEENAPNTQTVVDVEVVASGIVRSGEDRVQILVFVDRPTTNKLSQEPQVYRDQVTMTMERVDGEWLVDALDSNPGGR